jgi:hypothetical protein
VSESQKPALLYVLGALIFLECIALAVVTIYLVIEIFVGSPRSIGTSIALVVVVAIAAVLVGVVARATLSARPWIRGATVCIAVLQGLVAYSILITKAPSPGWFILLPAVVMLVLLFTPKVLRATARPAREE